MKTNAKKQIEQKTETIANDAIYCVARVARELGINEKRARTFLRKNADTYAPFRNQKFTKTSSLYKQCVDVLTNYKNKTRVITE